MLVAVGKQHACWQVLPVGPRLSSFGPEWLQPHQGITPRYLSCAVDPIARWLAVVSRTHTKQRLALANPVNDTVVCAAPSARILFCDWHSRFACQYMTLPRVISQRPLPLRQLQRLIRRSTFKRLVERVPTAINTGTITSRVFKLYAFLQGCVCLKFQQCPSFALASLGHHS